MYKEQKTLYLNRTQKDYSLSFKLQLVKEVESGEVSINGSLRKYAIQPHSTVLNWTGKYWIFDRELQVKFMIKKTPEQKLLELEAKVRLLGNRKKA